MYSADTDLTFHLDPSHLLPGPAILGHKVPGSDRIRDTKDSDCSISTVDLVDDKID
jgi:hypothetical protein